METYPLIDKLKKETRFNYHFHLRRAAQDGDLALLGELLRYVKDKEIFYEIEHSFRGAMNYDREDVVIYLLKCGFEYDCNSGELPIF